MNQQTVAERLQYFIERRLLEEGTINAMMEMRIVCFDEEKQTVTLAFPIREWQLNPAKHMHGGIICTALDITMGCAAYTFSQAEFTPTIQLSVNFVKGIPAGSELLIQGICDHSGSRMAQTRAIAFLAHEEEVVASANGSYAIDTRR